jgi:hypothetical protein
MMHEEENSSRLAGLIEQQIDHHHSSNILHLISTISLDAKSNDKGHN